MLDFSECLIAAASNFELPVPMPGDPSPDSLNIKALLSYPTTAQLLRA